jgi:4-amino-4-deoxy-L-arabinose transferase-like glycosyltransferase
MGNTSRAIVAEPRRTSQHRFQYELIVVFIAAVIYLGCIISPPHLLDDVDSVQAQIARNMLDSGDWVTATLDGIPYLEKSPLKYWMIAISYMIFGVHDWAARIPLALGVILLCWLTARFGMWAFPASAGLYAGLVMATCVGLWLFTRVQIPDAIVTLTVTLALWAFLRALDEKERRPRLWAAVMAASIGTGLLLKGLIAALFPIGAALLYLGFTRELTSRATWRRLHIPSGILIALAIAAPWHILATLRNPPYLDFTMKSEPGQYHGFFWFYFFNEHLFRFLNMRYPRDYNTVPRTLFWLFHLLWLFPWSVFLPAVWKVDFKPIDRAGRTCLLALCWIGFLLAFFTFSTTQEYYSMPCYPAFALLIGTAMLSGDRFVRIGSRVLSVIILGATIAIGFVLWHVWGLPTPGDISNALTQHPEEYTLSLGHMGDLTLESFAYLRLPLMLAGVACLIGLAGTLRFRGVRTYLAIAAMMVIFFHAARLALVVFDPYLGSEPLAEALNRAPEGQLIVDDQYYAFSSVFFYTNRRALLLNGRVNNLVYGSYAPGAPDMFIDDAKFKQLWETPARYYVVCDKTAIRRLSGLVGDDALHTVVESGGKFVLTNHADLR